MNLLEVQVSDRFKTSIWGINHEPDISVFKMYCIKVSLLRSAKDMIAKKNNKVSGPKQAIYLQIGLVIVMRMLTCIPITILDKYECFVVRQIHFVSATIVN